MVILLVIWSFMKLFPFTLMMLFFQEFFKGTGLRMAQLFKAILGLKSL
jgi:hypothetical protein